MRLAPLLALALLSAFPAALAQEAPRTLASLEEPHRGTDRLWDVRVLPQEANASRTVIFRNPPTSPFALIVYDSKGEIVYNKSGARGLQTLPGLPAGQYRFFVQRDGEFQVTEKAFERTVEGNVSTTLRGTDAYILAPSRGYRATIEGDVSVDWFDLVPPNVTLTPPATRDARPGGAYVITLRGAEGAAYSITLEPADLPAIGTRVGPDPQESPLGPLAAGALALAGAAAGRRAKAGRDK